MQTKMYFFLFIFLWLLNVRWENNFKKQKKWSREKILVVWTTREHLNPCVSQSCAVLEVCWYCSVDSYCLLPQGAILNVEDAATRLHLLNRSALRSVQAQARTPSSLKEQVPTLSPWGEVLTPIASSSFTHLNSKQDEYVKVSMYLS